MTKLYPSKGLKLLWKHRLLFFQLFFAFLFSAQTYGQAYMHIGRSLVSTGIDAANSLVTDEAGNFYLGGYIAANNYPMTIASPATGSTGKPVIFKLAPDGTVIWSRYLTNASGIAAAITRLAYSNGKLYMLGSTNITNLATTDGSVYKGGTLDMLFSVVNATTGAIETTTYLGGSEQETRGEGLIVENGFAYITFATQSRDIPVTTGPAFSNQYDHIIMKLRPDGSVVYSTYTGQSTTSGITSGLTSFAVHNGIAALGKIADVAGFPATDGSTAKGGQDYGVVRLNADGSTAYRTFIGGAANEENISIGIQNGEVYVSGTSFSSNYPNTTGTSFAGSDKGHVLTKLSSTGSIVYSTILAGLPGGIAVAGSASSVAPMILDNGYIYLMASTFGVLPVVTTTDGSTGGIYIAKLSATNGQPFFVTAYGDRRTGTNRPNGTLMTLLNGQIVATVPQSGLSTATVLSSDGFARVSAGGSYLAVFSAEGKQSFGTHKLTGFTSQEYPLLAAAGNRIYVAASWGATLQPLLTDPNYVSSAQADINFVGLTLCPPMGTQNDITPLSQSICAGGFTQALTGNKVAFSSENMPLLYRQALTYPQQEISARYQWQSASAATGPWTNINGSAGTLKDFAPPSLAETRYYRRLVLPAPGCGETPISTSAVAEVVVGANASPVVSSTVYNTCAGNAVDIEATITGGTAPYTITWDNGIASVTNTATVTPTGNSVYTISITDANGCEQKGQVVVNAHAANAGPDVNVCGGKPVRLGVAPPAGLAGVVYSWTPTAGLDDPTIAQPLASPGVNTTYTLSMTVPVSGGGTCNTTDDVNVTFVVAPPTANFAGADKATCKGDIISLGTVADPGFTYAWTPGNNLSAINVSNPDFNPGGELSSPNPITYTVTATGNGCSFTDQVTVAVLTADAGPDNFCGARTVGVADPMPNVTGKTFFWEVVSGPGTITGPTNTATTTVSESIGGTTVYQLTVSYLGASCTDQVIVPECGNANACGMDSIQVTAPNNCPSTTFGAVTLRAITKSSADYWDFSWSALPSGGLSATTGQTIMLTDNVQRDVTVTITSKLNPAYSCSKTIRVNDASWALPVFTAQDHVICAATPVNIGMAPVAGYEYTWTGVAVGDQYAANPSVTPALTANYIVTVKDIATGCTVRDTATVTVRNVVSDAGGDWTICSNSVIQLGSPARAGYTYSWTPAVAGYVDGTDASSAQPRVLVATTQSFTLRTTDTESGCFTDATANITVDAGATLPAMNNVTICRGASATIGNPGIGNVTYAWSPATGLSSTTVAQPVASPSATQVYTLVVTYYDGSGNITCSKSGSMTVTVNGPEVTMTDNVVCPSAAPYALNTTVAVTGSPTAYSWTPNLLVTTPGSLTTTVRNNPTTGPVQYTLVVRDAAGCADTATMTLSPAVTAPVAGSSGNVCVGGSVTLGDASNTGTITWTADQAFDGTLSNPNGASTLFTPAPTDAGKTIVFTISQDNGGGCVGINTVTIQVRANMLPAFAPQTICENAGTTIGTTAVMGVSYSWFPTTGLADPLASTTAVNNVTTNTTYTLTAVDVNGCVAKSDVVVGVNPVAAPTITIADVVTKVGNPAQAFNPQLTPAVGTYTYTWTPAEKVSDPYIANTVPTENRIGTYNYSLTVTDGNGCTSTAPALLRVENLNTLPVTLTSFTATTKDCGVTLNWKVESASNFSHFVVERSLNGSNYDAVKKLYYEYNRVNYYYQDAETGNGNWNYRLKMVDIDGRYEYSNMVRATVKCTSASNSLKIYPNPASSILYIKSSKSVKTVMVYGLSGNLVLRKDFAQSATGVVSLPVSHLVTGIYLVQVIAQDGTSQPARLVKE